MASFPSLALQKDDVKVRYLEPYGSDALNKFFSAFPLGVYRGFTPVVASSVVTFNVDSFGHSLALVKSAMSNSVVAIVLESAFQLDFSSHSTWPVYVVAKANYTVGSTTTAEIVTQTSAPTGGTEIGICKVTGTGSPGTITVTNAAPPDRSLPLANTSNAYGFMAQGDLERLAGLTDGRMSIGATKTTDYTAVADGRCDLLDFSASASLKTITLPDSTAAGNISGQTYRVVNITQTAATGARFLCQGTDVIHKQDGTFSTELSLRNFKGHFVELFLVETMSPAQWHIRTYTLQPHHGADHQAGGVDAIKLDDLAAPDDNTDLDVSTSAHGLMPKLGGSASNVLRMDGTQGPVPQPAAVAYDSTIHTTSPGGAVTADGRIYRFNATSGNITFNLPASAGESTGALVRFMCVTTGTSTTVARTLIIQPDGTDETSAGVGAYTVYGSKFGDMVELALDKGVTPARWHLLQRGNSPAYYFGSYSGNAADPYTDGFDRLLFATGAVTSPTNAIVQTASNGLFTVAFGGIYTVVLHMTTNNATGLSQATIQRPGGNVAAGTDITGAIQNTNASAGTNIESITAVTTMVLGAGNTFDVYSANAFPTTSGTPAVPSGSISIFRIS